KSAAAAKDPFPPPSTATFFVMGLSPHSLPDRLEHPYESAILFFKQRFRIAIAVFIYPFSCTRSRLSSFHLFLDQSRRFESFALVRGIKETVSIVKDVETAKIDELQKAEYREPEAETVANGNIDILGAGNP